MFTAGPVSRTGDPVLLLDIIALRALIVVVVYGLVSRLLGMEGWHFGHGRSYEFHARDATCSGKR